MIISDGTINYPYVRQPDILAAMSQAGFDKFVDQVKPEGFLLIDQDLVKPKGLTRDYFAVPSTRMAEELGRKMMANIIMIGFVTAVTKSTTVEATRQTVTQSVPKGTEEMNIKAFNKGYDYGLSLLKARDKKASGQAGALA